LELPAINNLQTHPNTSKIRDRNVNAFRRTESVNTRAEGKQGGFALAIHGFARATLDIDILIQPETLERIYEIGTENGEKD